jgi:biopolymer transport protein ExbB
VESVSLWSLMVKGGPVMIPIVVLSVVALALALERLAALWRIRLDLPRFQREIEQLVQKGQFQKAITRCREVRHPVGKVLELGVAGRGRPREELEKAMERVGEEHVERLERRLGALLAIVGVEPMLGFLGTIIGLIKAFMSWERLGANVTVDSLAAGIYQAMVSTAAGLAVAIPFFVCYHLFVGRIRRHAADMSSAGNHLLDLLGGRRPGGES